MKISVAIIVTNPSQSEVERKGNKGKKYISKVWGINQQNSFSHKKDTNKLNFERREGKPSPRSGLTSSFTNLGNQSVPNLERIKKNTSFCYPARRERSDKESSFRKTYRDIPKVSSSLYTQRTRPAYPHAPPKPCGRS